MTADERLDRLIAALERISKGPVPSRYLVRFPGCGGPDAACVVEAFSHDDAVKSAQIVLHRRGHDPCLVRPAKDDDCLACGAETSFRMGNTCEACGRTREQQMNFLRSPRSTL